MTELLDRTVSSPAPDWLVDYQRDGYVVRKGAYTPAEVDALNAEAVQLCRRDYGTMSLTELPAETAAVPALGPDATDAQVLRRYLALHFPHKVSELFRHELDHPSVVTTLTQAIGPDVKCMQSILFLKAEGKPGQAWHQDEYFIPTRDRSLTAAWLALDDATIDNGCLWVLPGSHRRGVIYPDREHDDARYDCAIEAYDFPYDEDRDSVPVEVSAGDVVLFNGYLLHRSLPNNSTRGLRRALVTHYMSATSLLPWMLPQDSRQYVGSADFRDIVMVAGTDPYAYKGIDDIHHAEVRPDRDGACLR